MTDEDEAPVKTQLDTYGRACFLMAHVSYRPGRSIVVGTDGPRTYLQVQAERICALTGAPGIGKGGKAYLSPYMTDSEIVRRAFGLLLAYEEHECREFFRFRGKAVFGPHISVDALVEVADRLEVRDG